jgi:hypothetical protein
VINVPSDLVGKTVKNVHATSLAQFQARNAKNLVTANQMSKVKNAINVKTVTLD